MALVNPINYLNQNEFRYLMNNNNGYCSSSDFLRTLRKERIRCKKTGSSSSYIVFDFSKYLKNIHTNGEYYRLLKKIIILISRNTREYDMKYLLSPSKIRLLLINVRLYDAEIFVEKIIIKLYEYLKFAPKGDFSEIINAMTITSYPLSQNHASIKIEKLPVLENYLNKKGVLNNQSYKSEDQEIPGFFMSWDKSVSSDGIISLTAPIFWDILSKQQIFVTYKLFKRLFDILGSLFFIILFSPMIFLISIAVKATSKGPVFFKQERLGYWGKPFLFLKFRTMYVDCDENCHKEYIRKLINGNHEEANLGTKDMPYYKLVNDPRITCLGKILRQSGLDEIPQLFNVLRGKMSLIGPRPPILYEVEEYKSWHFRRLFQVKPGITGLWQVSGRNRTTFDEMVRLDIQYAENLSLFLDIKILLFTLKAVLESDGN